MKRTQRTLKNTVDLMFDVNYNWCSWPVSALCYTLCCCKITGWLSNLRWSNKVASERIYIIMVLWLTPSCRLTKWFPLGLMEYSHLPISLVIECVANKKSWQKQYSPSGCSLSRVTHLTWKWKSYQIQRAFNGIVTASHLKILITFSAFGADLVKFTLIGHITYPSERTLSGH